MDQLQRRPGILVRLHLRVELRVLPHPLRHLLALVRGAEVETDIRVLWVECAPVIRCGFNLRRLIHNAFSWRDDPVIFGPIDFVEQINGRLKISNGAGVDILEVRKIAAPVENFIGHALRRRPVSIVLQAHVFIFRNGFQEFHQLLFADSVIPRLQRVFNSQIYFHGVSVLSRMAWAVGKIEPPAIQPGRFCFLFIERPELCLRSVVHYFRVSVRVFNHAVSKPAFELHAFRLLRNFQLDRRARICYPVDKSIRKSDRATKGTIEH